MKLIKKKKKKNLLMLKKFIKILKNNMNIPMLKKMAKNKAGRNILRRISGLLKKKTQKNYGVETRYDYFKGKYYIVPDQKYRNMLLREIDAYEKTAEFKELMGYKKKIEEKKLKDIEYDKTDEFKNIMEDQEIVLERLKTDGFKNLMEEGEKILGELKKKVKNRIINNKKIIVGWIAKHDLIEKNYGKKAWARYVNFFGPKTALAKELEKVLQLIREFRIYYKTKDGISPIYRKTMIESLDEIKEKEIKRFDKLLQKMLKDQISELKIKLKIEKKKKEKEILDKVKFVETFQKNMNKFKEKLKYLKKDLSKPLTKSERMRIYVEIKETKKEMSALRGLFNEYTIFLNGLSENEKENFNKKSKSNLKFKLKNIDEKIRTISR